MDFMTQSVYLTDHINGKRPKNKPHTPSSTSTLSRQIIQDRMFVANINRLHNIKYAGWVLKGEKNPKKYTTAKAKYTLKEILHACDCIAYYMPQMFWFFQPFQADTRNHNRVWKLREITYSSHCKSRVSLTLSRKQPSECMLSSTSGSSSVRDKIRLTQTRLGGGCSGHGSLRPPLVGVKQNEAHRNDTDVLYMIKSDHFSSHVWENERILTDTRNVSGWPLAVGGDRADGAISVYSLLTARWPQSCAV